MWREADRCNKTPKSQDIFIVTPSLEVQPTKAKVASFSHEIRLTPRDTKPVFQCIGEITISDS